MNISQVKSLIFLARIARARKVQQIQQLMELYELVGAKPFDPLVLKGRRERLIAPPVVEKEGKNLYVIDGSSRLFYWNKYYPHSVDTVRVAVVERCRAPRPAPGVKMPRVREEISASWAERYLERPEDARAREMFWKDFRPIGLTLGYVQNTTR